MKKISISLTEKQYDEIISLAQEKGLTINDLVLSVLPITQEKKVLLPDVLSKISTAPKGEFSIPSLFSKQEWSSFTKGSKLTVGKQFYKYAETSNEIKFIDKNSANLAIYNKI